MAGLADSLPLDLFAVRGDSHEGGSDWYLTFDKLVKGTHFVKDMRAILKVIQEAYAYPVDIEFTANFSADGAFRINLVQCRPFQVRIANDLTRVRGPATVNKQDLLMESSGPIIGQSSSTDIDRLIYIVPSVYGRMTVSERYSVARAIGKLNRLTAAGPHQCLMLAGPGRWATSTPALGIPVSFAEINAATVICEIAAMHEGLVPDISLGTHFFNDLVEMNMLYLAVSPEKKGHGLNPDLLATLPNALTTLLPEAANLAHVLRVIDGDSLPEKMRIHLHADSFKQKAVCYLAR